MTMPGQQPALTPIANTTRRETAVIAIRRALLSGELKPGQRVKETELAESLGISRPTAREAMNQLISEGSLVQEPYKGVRVAVSSPAVVLDVAEVRMPLETVAALRLARDASGEGIARLRRALDAHLAALSTGDALFSSRTHLDLHRTVWEASGNEMLKKMWPLVESQIMMALNVDQGVFHAPERDAELHQRLVDVIASGDEDAIVAEVRAHISNSAESVVGMMREDVLEDASPAR
ncbi:putative Transcriptional regulator, GntR family [Nostocoides japonicum T1-X7]|uniref:Putative Transcriptional regulator, GntR family n=1 Tax=Nostocoides japonicum T1-X7 TaxID=1194083 RepID=A0A077LTZ6_9MICO|nr:GntR family transcriptional regulator [Tetrasphaera japonica]CCH76007.1 putative Transcriptional regulator, GntR family [Tetrasphaera japonica T1-X7]